MKEKNLLAELAAYLFSRSHGDTGRTPSERELAEHFSVSRGQIREALAILEAMQIVERRAKSGIYLTTRQASVEAMALFAKAGVPLDPIPGDMRAGTAIRAGHFLHRGLRLGLGDLDFSALNVAPARSTKP